MEDAGLNSATLERWLSTPRLDTYDNACGGDLGLAMELYAWNISLAQAVLHDVAIFEVALRNAYDRCLTEGWARGDWLFDENSPVRRHIMRTNRRGSVHDVNRTVRSAIDRLGGETRPHDWIVSNLTLGFWAHLADRARERDVWIPHLHRAWPAGMGRVEVSRELQAITATRNRAVHHEHLFSLSNQGISVAEVGGSITSLFSMLVPDVADTLPVGLHPTAVTKFVESTPPPVRVGL